MNSLVSKQKHLYLYIYEDSLFVWSGLAHALYGFRGFHAALFLFMQESEIRESVDKFILDSGVILDDETQKLIELMTDIIDGKTVQEESQEIKPFSLLDVMVDKKSGWRCSLQGFEFFIGFEDEAIEKLITPDFNHLKSESTQTTLPLIDINFNNNIYEIFINGTKLHEAISLKHIVPMLQDTVRMLYYHNISYLMTLHAAALEYQGKTLILPGVSGSGKSTLSSYLMHEGFNLFSDELSVIKSDYTIAPLPFNLSIKEGSWETVSQYIPDMQSLEMHRRFDEQKIYTLPPIKMAEENISVLGGYVIFPKYVKDASVTLTEISVIEALGLINEAKYHIADSKSLKHVEDWLKILTSSKIYGLSYGSLEEAKKTIEKVMNA